MIVPLLLAWKRRPRLTAAGIGRVHRPATVPRSARRCTGTASAAPVVKVQANGLAIGVPDAFCAPDTVAV